ncbi:MAG: hypothetical protein ACXQTS_05020, partial [Candidatus Methanospirareceae archaeon]
MILKVTKIKVGEIEAMTMSILEKIGLLLVLSFAIILSAFSLFSLIVDIFLKFDLYSILIDLLFFGIGISISYFSIHIYKKSTYYERLVNSAFDEGIYRRLEPLLRKVAEAHVKMEDIESRLDIIDRKVETVIEEQVKMERRSNEMEKAIAPGTSIGFIIKTIFLAIITMSGFLFMIYTFIGIAHYTTLAFYILWWVFISAEFDLFHNSTAWVMVFIPILLVPVGFMTLDAIIGPNNTVAIFYALLTLYAFLYYSWA